MKVVCISDTHGRHERLFLQPCDLLVHAGDMTVRGRWAELESFAAWFARQRATHKVFIAGNHDLCCERDAQRVRRLAAQIDAHYLCDEGVQIEGRTVWGSPMTPRFRDMAFNRDRGDAIARHWAEIPGGLDLLVTHGPPHGIGDRMFLGRHVGCEALAARVRQVPPRVHVFGHIHEDAGSHDVGDVPTRFFNVASSRLIRRGPRPAVTFEL